MSKDGLTIKGLDKYVDWLNGLSNDKMNKFKDRLLRSSALRGLEHVDNLTPRHTGRLQNSAQVGDKDNVFKIAVSRYTSYVFFGTAVEYARYVEEGFQQKAGQFVPGFWQGDTFHYDPGSKTGMVLTGKVIEGAHMYSKALDYLKEDMDEIARFEFRRLYAELF